MSQKVVRGVGLQYKVVYNKTVSIHAIQQAGLLYTARYAALRYLTLITFRVDATRR